MRLVCHYLGDREEKGVNVTDRWMRSFHVLNTDPSGSRAPNSGLRRVNAIFEGCRAPSELVFGKSTITTAAAILYESLAASILGERGCP